MTHSVNVRDKPAFLRRLIDEFAGGRMSLEGDLSRCAFHRDVVLGRDEIGILRRNTLYPRQDFVVLRLEPGAAVPIFKQIMAAGLKRAIIHVQIEHQGVLQLGAYDHFHAECVVTGARVAAGLLSELQASGILRGFHVTITAGGQDAEPCATPEPARDIGSRDL